MRSAAQEWDRLRIASPCPVLKISDVLNAPLPHLAAFDRLLLRAMALAARTKVLSVTGADHIAADRDPFIVVFNHGTRQEALIIPPLLMLLRAGRRIHFLADWNFRLIPGVATLYRRAGVITVTRKSARPRVLNVLKPLFRTSLSPLEQARRCIADGGSIGVFPEGTVNRDPHRLLHGRLGAARLSLETGAAVLPVGLRFPLVPQGVRVPEGSAISVEIGAPLLPPAIGRRATTREVRAWHARIMTQLSALSGKSWQNSKENDDEWIGIHQNTSRRDRGGPSERSCGLEAHLSGREGLGAGR